MWWTKNNGRMWFSNAAMRVDETKCFIATQLTNANEHYLVVATTSQPATQSAILQYRIKRPFDLWGCQTESTVWWHQSPAFATKKNLKANSKRNKKKSNATKLLYVFVMRLGDEREKKTVKKKNSITREKCLLGAQCAPQQHNVLRIIFMILWWRT